MKQQIKKKITIWALIAAILIGFGSTSSLTVYAANTNTTASTSTTQVEALKTYKGNTTTFNAYDYYMNNADLQTAIGADGDALLKHYNENGKKEGRVAIAKAASKVDALKTYKGNTAEFNAYDYYMNNTDLQTAVGADGDALLKHYKAYGKKEGRVAVAAKTVTAAATTAAASKASSKSAANSGSVKSAPTQQNTEVTYVLNTNTHKFHYPTCKDTQKIKAKNYATTSASRDDVIAQGYSPCGHCHP